MGGRAGFHDCGRQAQAGIRKRGIKLDRSIDPEITYTYFNMHEMIGDQPNPVAGFTKEKIALRRAIAMAYNVDDQIRIIRNGQAVRAQFPIPPGVAGHEPQYRSSIPYDPQLANALLDKFGFRRGPDGYRTQPDGKPLVIRYSSLPTGTRPAVRRADEALARFDRHPARNPQGPLPGIDEARE